MGTPATGELRPTATGFEARIRIEGKVRKGFPLAFTDEAEARARCKAMAEIAVRLRKAGHVAKVEELLGMAAKARTERTWQAVTSAVDTVCGGHASPAGVVRACLLGVAPIYQRYIVTIGKGGEGKSTLTQIAVSAMPVGTTCAIAPQEWGNEYRRALLVGKRLNAVAELPEADIIASESVKAIITGDPIVGREIRQAPMTFTPIAGHMFAANKLPGTNDQSDGFWRRIMVLTFNRSFTNDADRNPRIAPEIIEAELPGIVAWMLQGAVRLFAQADYTLPPSHHAALAEWRKNADQVALFVEAETRPLRPEESMAWAVAAADLYAAYQRWCVSNGHRPLASNKFGARMSDLGRPSKKSNTGWRYPVVFLTAVERARWSDTSDTLVTGLASSVSPQSNGVANA